MRRRILGLLCALALCLGLTPATALAVGEDVPDTLWVGETQITGSSYWTIDTNGKLTAGGASNYNVHYDGNGTLTLNNATIKGRGDSSNSEPQDYGIYAATAGNQSVSLTIKLIGSNTVSGYSGICVEVPEGNGNSTLVIQSDGNDPKGSLEAIGSGWNGITVSSESGNASLAINDASVVANMEGQSYHGVSIKSNSQGSPALSLSVDGGSLTAQSTNGYGIVFSASHGTTDPSTSMTVQSNALVKATSIIASLVGEPTPQGDGIVFDGAEGTVYGNVTLDSPLTVDEDETLTIPEGSALSTNGNLTNDGTIVNKGTMNGDPTGGSGTVVTAPAITTESLPEGTAGQPYTATLKATGNNIAWSLDSGTLPDCLTLSSDGAISGTPTTAGTYAFTVTAANDAGSDSKEYTLTITTVPVTGVSLDKASLSLYAGGTATLAATVAPDDATNKKLTWSSDAEGVATVDGNGKVTAVAPGTAIITAAAADGSGQKATCTVTVRRYVPPAPAKTPSEQALDKIGSADDGDTVSVSLPAGDTVLDAEVFEALAGRDVTLVVRLPGGAAWTVDGKDVPEGAELADIDMGVTMGADAIPADVVNAVTGEAGTVQLALAHDGLFGFEMTLTAPVGAEGAGLWANLYRYDEDAGRLVFQASARVGEDGTAALPFDHASQWAIVLDTVSHELPFSDVSPADWFANPVGEAYRAGLMTGYAGGSGLFGPDDVLTRAQAAAVLCRALGTDAEAPACGMADVDPGAWYAGPVDWAVSSGLMVGYGDGTGRFGVDDALTREQLAVVLWRAAGSPDAGAYDGSAFSDGGDASGWAEPALAWAVKTGVLGGSDDGSGGTELRPTAAITRAEAATMLARRLATK